MTKRLVDPATAFKGAVDVDGVMLWGAHCREWGKKPADNPYAAAPGTYVLHNAWKYGFVHAAEVMAQWLGDDPSEPQFDDLRGPVPH